MSWIVAATHPGKEHIALQNLQRQGYTIYYPKIKKRRSHARKTEWVVRPLFPGYVFIFLDETCQVWRPIQSTIGVRCLIQFGNKLSFLPQKIVDGMRAQEVDGFIPEQPLSQILKSGSKVRVLDGAFRDFWATVLGVRVQDRVSVLLEIMGRQVKTVLPGDSLETC